MNIKDYSNIIESELFKIGPTVVFIWENKENWPVFSVSENILNIYGYKSSEFLLSDLRYADLVHKDDIDFVSKEVIEASDSNKESFEHNPYRVMCKDGKYKWVQDTTIIIRDKNKITHYIGYLHDITELKESERARIQQNKYLLKNEALLQSYKIAMDESSIISKSDLQGNITYVNDNFCEISGYSREELIGKPHSLVKSSRTDKKIIKCLWKTITSKSIWKGILLNKGKKDYYWVDISIVPILNEKNDITEYIAIRHDITQVKEQQKKLDNIANTDILTGYGNRYKLNNDIKNSINPALATLDIDNFSQLNDFYGHEQGDNVIKKLGMMIENIIAEDELQIYHLQGDEYVVFSPDITKELFIEKITHLTSEIIMSSIHIEDEEVFLNLSTAVSFENKETILLTADMALKVAKRENKNLIIYSESVSLNAEYKNNIKWTRKIKEAISEDRITPVFQPIVNNNTNKWEKYESLIRLKDTDGTLITPFFFLEISKKTKHYSSLTKIMLKKAFDTFRNLEVEFSVNITINDILKEDINAFILGMLKEYCIGERVVFEIVESESIENFEVIEEFIIKLKSYGAKVAIDDFGTGYSNFEYLMKLKADYIKIDGSIIKYIDENYEAQMVVATIVDFAKKMNIKTIAEFVESESIYNKVKELGIDYSQGYYFSKPISNI